MPLEKTVDIERMEIVLSEALQFNVQTTLTTLESIVGQMRLYGVSDNAIREVLARDLESGGRLFGAFRSGIRSTIQQAVNLASQEGMAQTYEKSSVWGKGKFKWIVVSSNPCPDCVPRHGQVETMQYWRTVGMPGSGFSVCQSHCHCRLVTASYRGENLDNPVIRKR